MDEDLKDIITKLKNRGGPATETTLSELVAELTGKKGGTKSLSEEQAKLTTATKKTGSYLGDLGEETQEAKEAMQSFRRKSLETLSTGFEIFTGNLGDAGRSLNSLAYEFSGITRYFIRSLGYVTNLLSEQVDVFRSLSSIGGAFGQDLSYIRNVAGKAGVDLDMLSGAAFQLGQNLGLMGESSAKAQADFFKTIESVTQGETRQQFAALGFTMAEVVEASAEFAELQTTLGRYQNMSEAQRVKQTGDYIMQLDMLTRLTGKSRKQLQDEMQERANDDRLKLKMSKMSLSQQNEVNQALSQTSGISRELEQEIRNLVAQNGVEFTERQAGIMSMKGMRNAIRALSNGEPGSGQALMKVFADQARVTQNMTKQQIDELGLQKQAGVAYNDFIFMTLNAAKAQKDLSKMTKEQEKALEAGAKSALQFDQATLELRNSFKALLAPIVEGLSVVFGGLAEMITTVAGTIQKFDSGLAKVIATMAAVAVGGGAAYGGAKLIGGGLKKAGSYLPGAGMFKTLGAGGGAMMSGAAKGIKAFAMMGPKILIGAAVIAGVVAILGAGVGIGAYAAGKGIQTLAEGLTSFQNVDGEKLKEVASASSKLSLAITQMGASSVKGAVTGFFGKLFGGGPENFAKSINKTLDELDKDKIDMYANSLENLGNAMTSLRTGMTGATTASATATGDKLDRLNTTMEQILMVLGEGNRYNRITSKATSDTAENFS